MFELRWAKFPGTPISRSADRTSLLSYQFEVRAFHISVATSNFPFPRPFFALSVFASFYVVKEDWV